MGKEKGESARSTGAEHRRGAAVLLWVVCYYISYVRSYYTCALGDVSCLLVQTYTLLHTADEMLHPSQRSKQVFMWNSESSSAVLNHLRCPTEKTRPVRTSIQNNDSVFCSTNMLQTTEPSNQ